MTGKEKCCFLKDIRLRIAKLNGIEYKFKECTHEGPCIGSCPACDLEATELMSELYKKEAAGSSIKVDTDILHELDILASNWNRIYPEPTEDEGTSETAESDVIMTPGMVEGKLGVTKGKLRGTLMGDVVAPDDNAFVYLGDIEPETH